MVIFFGEMSHFSVLRLHCACVLPGVLMAPGMFFKQLFPKRWSWMKTSEEKICRPVTPLAVGETWGSRSLS